MEKRLLYPVIIVAWPELPMLQQLPDCHDEVPYLCDDDPAGGCNRIIVITSLSKGGTFETSDFWDDCLRSTSADLSQFRKRFWFFGYIKQDLDLKSGRTDGLDQLVIFIINIQGLR